MPSAYVVKVDDLSVTINRLDDAPTKIRRTASRAINRTLTRTRTASERSIREQVAFPVGYLKPSAGRLKVSETSKPNSLSGAVRGRQSATSLARFALNRPKRGGQVRLRVKPNRTTVIPGAFLINLRRGDGSGDGFNRGLAVRLKPGERLRNKRNARQLGNGLYLLYGPSVDQVFQQVAREEAEPAGQFLEQEFLRQLEL